MSELPEGISPADEPTPRDSASGIVLRRDGEGRLTVLLGLRSRQSRFMPGHLAFPGGAMEPEDRPDEAGAWRRCASREVREETGFEIPVDHWHEAGERITPPMFPVRFRTRFFAAVLPPGGPANTPSPADRENERVEFGSAAEVLDDWSRGETRVPPPVLALLRTLAATDDRSVDELALDLARANEVEERSPRIEFAPRVWALPVRTATLPPATHTNVWMPGGRRFVVIDPGTTEPGEIDRLVAVVERRRALGDTLQEVLLTHHHRDHTGGAVELASRLGCGVGAHPQVLDGLGAVADRPARRPLADGERLDLEGMTLEVLHTPGHAPGHYAFLLVEPGILIAGDLIGGMSTILIDPQVGDMDAYMASLARVAGLRCRLLLPGHGPPLPGSALARLIEHRATRESTIRRQLAEGSTSLAEIAEAAYQDLPQMPSRLTETQTLSHLIRLERHGVAKRLDEHGSSWQAIGEIVAEGPGDLASLVREILEARFQPIELTIDDESELHRGHVGAISGGGHLRLLLVSREFEGCSRLEQHRQVYAALEALIPGRIHALALVTRAPSEPAPTDS